MRSRLYPVKDGYKDTVQILGTTPRTGDRHHQDLSQQRHAGEGLGAGDQERLATPATWTGPQGPTGRVLPSGTYQVKQSFKDARRQHEDVTTDVYLSPKKLYWYVEVPDASYANTGRVLHRRSLGRVQVRTASRIAALELDGGWYPTPSRRLRATRSRSPTATIYKLRAPVRSTASRSARTARATMIVPELRLPAIRDGDHVDRVFDRLVLRTSVSATDHVNSTGKVGSYVEGAPG